jgi:hypothetical protein
MTRMNAQGLRELERRSAVGIRQRTVHEDFFKRRLGAQHA